jgi:hypothetical protein
MRLLLSVDIGLVFRTFNAMYIAYPDELGMCKIRWLAGLCTSNSVRASAPTPE